MTNPNDEKGQFLSQGIPIGLTKREYFAAMAMQANISSGLMPEGMSHEELAKESLRCADALIRELSK